MAQKMVGKLEEQSIKGKAVLRVKGLKFALARK